MSGLAFYFYVPVLRWLPRASKLCAYVRSGNKFKSGDGEAHFFRNTK